jgi:ribosomal protein L37AE/L43A
MGARVPSHTISRPDHLVCLACGYGELRIRGVLSRLAECDSCGCVFNEAILRTLEQIVALPDPIEKHACECGYPEMRRLPDGVFHCPACGSEVLPVGSITGSSEPPPSKSLLAFA